MQTHLLMKHYFKKIVGMDSFRSQVAITMGMNILLSVIGLITGPLAARVLGPSGRGELAAIQNWPTLFAMLAACGLPEAVVFFSARNPEKTGRYMTSASALVALISIPVIFIAYILMPTLLASQTQFVVVVAKIYLFYVILGPLLLVQISALRGRTKLLVWNLLRGMPNFIWMMILVGAWFKGSATPQGLAYIYLIALAALLVPWFLIIKKSLAPPVWPPDIHQWQPLIKYGFPLVSAGIPSQLNLRVDQLLMISLFSPQVLGYYVVAVAWSGALGPIVQGIGMVLFPRTAAQHSVHERDKFLIRGVGLASVTSLIMSVPIFIVTPQAIRLFFGDNFTPAIPAALILVVASIFLNMKTVLQEGARGIGEPNLVFVSEWVGLIVTGIMLFFLIKPYGIIGAAISSLVAYSVTYLYLLFMIARKTNEPYVNLLLPRKNEVSDLAALMRAALSRK